VTVYGVVHERDSRHRDRPDVRQAHLDGRHRRALQRMQEPAPNCTHAFRIRWMPLLWICQLCGAAVTAEQVDTTRTSRDIRRRLLRIMDGRSA